MSSTAASGFVFLLLSVKVIQSQDGWGVIYTSTDVCNVIGSRVYMNCRYTYPSIVKDDDIKKTFWFTKEKNGQPVDLMSDSQYTGRVRNECHDQRCTLIISDLRKSDGAEYKFRFIANNNAYTGSPGVTLSVTDPGLEVMVSKVDSTRMDLKCLSSYVLTISPSYIWYMNEEKIEAGSSSLSVSFGSSYSYSCSVQGQENICSPPVYAPRLPSVSVSPSDEIVEGSSVTLTCSSNANPAASYTWHKVNQHIVMKTPELVFSSIKSSDSGGYYCEAVNQMGTKSSELIYIDVKYAPRLPSVTVSPSGEIVEGNSVTLNCSSDANPAANYTWYKEKQKLLQGPEGVYRFSSISSKDSGTYYCKPENKNGEFPPMRRPVNVEYRPKVPSVFASPTNRIIEGSSVTLICIADANPAPTYSWFRGSQILIEGPEGVYYFTSISSKNRGTYYCKSKNKHGRSQSKSFVLDVLYAPRLPSVSVSPSDEIMEGNSVNLTCSSDANPAANYTWYKEKETYPFGEGDIHHFTSIRSNDSGIYYCKSENQHGEIMSPALSVDVQYAPRFLSVSVSPSDEIMEDSSVTLTCSSDANPAASYTWYKGKKKLLREPRGVYHFTSISFKNRGTYYCKSENKHGSIDSSSLVLNVLYAPKLPSVSVSPSEIMEGNSVNLTCSSDANPAASYTWYKVNEDLPKASGRIFVITTFTDEHSGIYSCEAKNTIGRSNSIFYLSVAAPAAIVDIKTTVLQSIYWILAVLVLSSLILFFLWFRKKKAVISTTEPDENAEALERCRLNRPLVL